MVIPQVLDENQSLFLILTHNIGSDHSLVTAHINLLTRWRQQNYQNKTNNEQVYKTYLLQEESVRGSYQNRLAKYFTEVPKAPSIDSERHNIKYVNAAKEEIGTRKKYKSKRGLKTWNEEIKEAIETKGAAHQIYFKCTNEESRRIYTINKNSNQL